MNKIKVQKTIDSFFPVKRKKSIITSNEGGTNNSSDSVTSTCVEELEGAGNGGKKRKIDDAVGGGAAPDEVSSVKGGLNTASVETGNGETNVGEVPTGNRETYTADVATLKETSTAEPATHPYAEEIKNLMHAEWYEHLKDELRKSYFQKMYLKIKEERKTKVIYPPARLVFNAFLKTPLSNIKVVIVGQDPYHQKGQAMGLCFSVPIGIKIPPSLKNILKEIKQTSSHGDLISWAEQGVFLLNTSLTVEENKPASHKNYGWETFTDRVINIINEKKEKIIFMLWGNFAIKKCSKIDTKKHFILKAGHPSPLSVRHFANCDHFNKCNEILTRHGMAPIRWELPQ
ncbi:uracil-DNA glycosylase, putative [Plasmodium vivax]|uniref:Uracil-DNA glycosylase n=6 Tax=Plasmodium vivax TaxID=5855 RepID=A5K179_PLAVS|nr:uracil-DNA glycosylase, putative [Plasmodium vivax]KMZ78266.1 uracil-DNA glycosylase [Plasmodium vivax India VII]KMZ83871.1 uracil-DNA glycosylase [Plasmodium vivax Brazil I]KMZ90708.1 uracil-DNA glycosylase [Plasmodium vivax Mauritania I]KMZ97393.1 uracil-DNA glycosylase [Plasmodium vivax North Korean]EDL47076.1 uracil-DNA glycosylase, putative [Plasmodium vivax]|eukprot:XP_001616803.1 uracil-DNA glycosylase [Plasmodium vivax Sal-1]